MLNKYRIILASNSPRRSELLKGLNLTFEVFTFPNLQESYPDVLREGDIPLFLAKQKNAAYDSFLTTDDVMIITADTIVWHNDKVLGKPQNREEAIEMLRNLSDDIHQVYTGVCIRTKNKEVSFISSSNVKFAKLNDEEISFYVDTYKPYDKAGAYGVQEWIGYAAVEFIEGSFYNIMGLPIQRLYQELKRF